MIIYLWGIFMTIVGILVIVGSIGKIGNDDHTVQGFIALIVGIASIWGRWYVKNGNKCPHCGKPHGPQLVSFKVTERGRHYHKNNREYERQLRDNSYKCKFCKKEWVVEGVPHDEEILHY